MTYPHIYPQVAAGMSFRLDPRPKDFGLSGHFAHGVVETQPVGSHFRLMIFDDLVTPASVSTPDQVKKTTVMHALADNLGARDTDGLKLKWHRPCWAE
jgi:hypothetical protein